MGFWVFQGLLEVDVVGRGHAYCRLSGVSRQ